MSSLSPQIAYFATHSSTSRTQYRTSALMALSGHRALAEDSDPGIKISIGRGFPKRSHGATAEQVVTPINSSRPEWVSTLRATALCTGTIRSFVWLVG